MCVCVPPPSPAQSPPAISDGERSTRVLWRCNILAKKKKLGGWLYSRKKNGISLYTDDVRFKICLGGCYEYSTKWRCNQFLDWDNGSDRLGLPEDETSNLRPGETLTRDQGESSVLLVKKCVKLRAGCYFWVLKTPRFFVEFS